MEPEDLRIGNYIEYEGIIYFIQDISMFKGRYTSNLFLSPVHSFATHYNIPILDLQPVPLTKDKLIELGLQKDKQDTGDHFYSKEDFSIIMYDEYVSYFDGDIETKIRSVHHLQNLYYDLKGKELVNENIKT